ncbi:MAG: lysylphosphatidylglycerol synthase transmembrane domain-containing protein [Candidatus Stygibacter frigidus]|nr:lysylphosphatidylglycerol synthase transmembrane domain-containing protein [Candidatus Stygibacter frigidus]
MTGRKKILKLVQLAVTILLLGYLVIHWGYSFNLLAADARMPLWLLPCIFNAVFITPLLAGCRWQAVLKAVRVPAIQLMELIKINFLSIFWGAMLPSGDGFAFIRMALIAHKHPEIKEKTIGSIVLEKYFGVLILLTTALAAGFFLGHPQTGNLRIILIILLSVMIGLVALIALMPGLKKPVTGNSIFKRVQRFIQMLLFSWQTAEKGKLILACLFIFSVQVMSYIVIYSLFRFMGYDLPMLNHFCLVPIIQVISLLPFTIGGFGIREGAFIYFYQQLGVPAHSLITLSILNFFIQTGIPALIGGIYSLAGHISFSGVRE